MSVSKSIRQLAVHECLVKLKRARTEHVVASVANKLGVDVNDSFKRAILRDLRDLVDSHRLGCDYYTPGGEPIEPGEESGHANLRTEYYVLSNPGDEIDGYHLLRAAGGDLLTKKVLLPSLHVAARGSTPPKGSARMTVEFAGGHRLDLWVSKLDLPLRFQICRYDVKFERAEVRKAVAEALGARTALLALPDQSISGLRPDHSAGHCEIAFEKEGVRLKDQGSRNGTQFSTRAADVQEFIAAGESAAQTLRKSAIAVPEFSAAKGEIETAMPALLLIGRTSLVVREG